MTCTNCGATLESTATTCPVCGSAAPGAPGDPGNLDASAREATSGAASWQGAGASDTPPSSGGASSGGGAGYGGAGYGGAGYGGTTGGGASTPGGAAWQQPAAPHPSGLPSDIRGWGIGAHAASYLAFIGLPVVGPLLVWLIRRDHPFVDHHGKESLNFNLSVALYGLVLAVAAIPLGFLTLGIALVPIGLLGVVLGLVWLVLPVIGCVKASNGEGYRYPMTIRFVR
ncbi:DUF4870 domain-containing protein [Egicoccus sp. AB-alg6-2]|uniref:DUF4870 domain-containing protein n=1 Tax=Egicoccus sp. AB-alg6-2 TaxID=3242692 RepID=UPI00359D161F